LEDRVNPFDYLRERPALAEGNTSSVNTIFNDDI